MLTWDEKKKSLQYLMFLKQKRCSHIKGHGCMDGWGKQHIYEIKEETSAPTVSVESLFLSCMIDTKEHQKVITCDIPGAFMQADINEVLHVRLEGPLAQLSKMHNMKVVLRVTHSKDRKDVVESKKYAKIKECETDLVKESTLCYR
jgi:hypothetical protein